MINVRKVIFALTCLLFITFLTLPAFCVRGVWHVVRKGETVWSLSQRYKTKQKVIMKANKLRSPRNLSIGQKLFIPGIQARGKISGKWYIVGFGDTLWKIARRNHINTSDIVYVNNIKTPNKLRVGQVLFIPKNGFSKTCLPLHVPIFVTSGYGYRIHPISRRWCFHHGIDLRAKVGTRVYAVKSGKVIFVGRKGGYGKIVMIKHADGFSTRYGHLYKIYVSHGQRVKKGKAIGLSGNTGYSTGPHLHFEVRHSGKSVDPKSYVKF